MDNNDLRDHARLSSLPPLAVEQLIRPPNALGDRSAAFITLAKLFLEGLPVLFVAWFLGFIPALFCALVSLITSDTWASEEPAAAKRWNPFCSFAAAIVCVPVFKMAAPGIVRHFGSHVIHIEAGLRLVLFLSTLAGVGSLTVHIVACYLRTLLCNPRIPHAVREARRTWYANLFHYRSLLQWAQDEETKASDPAMDTSARQRHAVRAQELRRLAVLPRKLGTLLLLFWLPATMNLWYRGRSTPADIALLSLPLLLLTGVSLLVDARKKARFKTWGKALTVYLTGEGGERHSGLLNLLIMALFISSQAFHTPFSDWLHGGLESDAFSETVHRAFTAFSQGQSAPVFMTLIALALSLIYPLVVLECLFLFAATPFLAAAEDALENDEVTQTPWEGYVEQLLSSPYKVEREHLWLGVHPTAGYPVVLDRAILQEHSYHTGDSGSGKTSLGLCPLAIQLIRQRNYDDTP